MISADPTLSPAALGSHLMSAADTHRSVGQVLAIVDMTDPQEADQLLNIALHRMMLLYRKLHELQALSMMAFAPPVAEPETQENT